MAIITNPKGNQEYLDSLLIYTAKELEEDTFIEYKMILFVADRFYNKTLDKGRWPKPKISLPKHKRTTTEVLALNSVLAFSNLASKYLELLYKF